MNIRNIESGDHTHKAGITPNVGTYNRLLDKAQTIDEGRTILADMGKAGVTPNVVTNSTLHDKLKTLEEGAPSSPTCATPTSSPTRTKI